MPSTAAPTAWNASGPWPTPVIGHVGFIPYRTNWIGGPCAIGVEMELVPHRVATGITKRTSLCVISTGSGHGCDAQYLFAEDILGTNRGHFPRHAKQYVNLQPEYARIRGLMKDAFTQYATEVRTGAFPDARRVVDVKETEFTKFVAGL